MAFKLPINVHETTNTTGLGDLTVVGAVSGARPFSADLVNGDTTLWCLAPNGSTDREFHRGAWNTGSILTRSTSTLIESTTGGLINLGSGPHDVFVVQAANRFKTLENLHSNYIDGLTYEKTSATSITIHKGFIAVNGAVLELTSDTAKTIDSTSEIGSSSLSSNQLTFLYARNNSGTLEFWHDIRTGASIDPVYDAELRYWKHPTQGADYRFIGILRTISTATDIADFGTRESYHGNLRTYFYQDSSEVLTTTSTTYVAFTFADYAPPSATSLFIYGGVKANAGTGMVEGLINFDNTEEVSILDSHMFFKGYVDAINNTIFFGLNEVPIKNGATSMYGKVRNISPITDSTVRIFMKGCSFVV